MANFSCYSFDKTPTCNQQISSRLSTVASETCELQLKRLDTNFVHLYATVEVPNRAIRLLLDLSRFSKDRRTKFTTSAIFTESSIKLRLHFGISYLS